MQLSTLRAKLIDISGRRDLVTGSNVDNGANFYINAGIGLLEKKLDIPATLGKVFKKITVGTWYYAFTKARVFQTVWVRDAESRYELERIDIGDMRGLYSEPISSITQGVPLYWTPDYLRGVITTDKGALATFDELTTTTDKTERAISFYPPADTDYVLEIWGDFPFTEVSNDADETYLMTNCADLVIMAACYKMEVMNRNSEGMKDWMNAISVEIDALNADTADEESNDVDCMEG